MEGAKDSGAPASTCWSGEYTWSIRNVANVDRKLYSEPFEIGTYSWRLLVFPRGNDKARPADHLAVYLDFPEASYMPPHMCPRARLEFVVENQLYPEKTVSRETHHAFTNKAKDWGFAQFLPLSDVNDAKKGFVIDDKLDLKVKITVQRDDRHNHTSRKETGYVGLNNQGATDYLNFLLQYLYHLPYFRKAVYHMPTLETDEPELSVPYALQSLFFKLQHSPTSVSTKALTKSFGWGTYDSFVQHNEQEMEAKLMEELQKRMKGTKDEKAIQYLFVGHCSSHIVGIDVDFKRATQQSFMTIQLEVKGCSDVYASLDKFCGEERLEGQNKYYAEGHGAVDAIKYVRFDNFPPVLRLELERFGYDYQRDSIIKICDRYEFCSSLDLDIKDRKYLTENSDRSVRNLYKLHSVLVHSGGAHAGHYFAFIRPGDEWYKFDDETVREETEKRAIQDQFGGDAKQSTAYMLVYIRESDWDTICCPCEKEDIAEHIRNRLEVEQLEQVRRQREKETAHLYVVIKVACDRDFQKQIGNSQYFDLVNLNQVKSYRIHKKTVFQEFQQKVAEDFGVQPSRQRFWVWKQRHSGTVRPDSPLPSGGKIDDVLDLRNYKDNLHSPNLEQAALMTIALYLEVPESPTRPMFDIPPDTVLLFFKLYDPHKRHLSYVAHRHVHKAEPFSKIFKTVGELAGFTEGTEIVGCEEISFEPEVLCEDLPADSTPEKSQLICGDVICVQKRLTDVEAHELELPTVRRFLESIRNIDESTSGH